VCQVPGTGLLHVPGLDPVRAPAGKETGQSGPPEEACAAPVLFPARHLRGRLQAPSAGSQSTIPHRYLFLDPLVSSLNYTQLTYQ